MGLWGRADLATPPLWQSWGHWRLTSRCPQWKPCPTSVSRGLLQSGTQSGCRAAWRAAEGAPGPPVPASPGGRADLGGSSQGAGSCAAQGGADTSGGSAPPTAAPLPRLPVCPVFPEPAPAPPAAPAWAPVHGPRVAPGRGCLHLGGGCVTWGWGARAGLPHAPRTALKALPTDPRAGPRRQGRVPAAPRASHAPQPRARGPHPPRPPSAPNHSQSPAR